MPWARIRDALAIWDGSPAPYGDGVLWLKVKASICIALGREGRDTWDAEHVAVWCSSQWVHESYEGPQCSWREVSVSPGLTKWKFYSYTNGF